VLGRLSQLKTRTHHRPTALLLATLALTATPALASGVEYAGPPEDYARYEGQTTCVERAQPGTRKLAGWINRRFGGGKAVASLRSCPGGTSEHKDGRAFDWTLDATRKRDRRVARSFLRRVLASDRQDRPHALARRMGIMYVIWNDQMWSSWDRFDPEAYLSSSCRSRKRCSKTLRHRDHLHVSLSKPGARARTSWYDGRVS
jgi:hypothetical protein